MEIVAEGVRMFGAKVGTESPNGQIHDGQPPCCGIGFLSVDGNVADTTAVFFDEFFRLNKHASGAATWVIDTALVRCEHFNKNANNAARRVELATLLPFGAGKLREEIVKPKNDFEHDRDEVLKAFR